MEHNVKSANSTVYETPQLGASKRGRKVTAVFIAIVSLAVMGVATPPAAAAPSRPYIFHTEYLDHDTMEVRVESYDKETVGHNVYINGRYETTIHGDLGYGKISRCGRVSRTGKVTLVAFTKKDPRFGNRRTYSPESDRNSLSRRLVTSNIKEVCLRG